MRNFSLPMVLVFATSLGSVVQSEVSAQSQNAMPTGAFAQIAPSSAKSGAGVPPESAMLQSHFERYCDYRGGLPIGSYDIKFRQQLKLTDDNELKRLFVLKHLYRDLDAAMRDFRVGEVRVGKVGYRVMTDAERVAARRKISKLLDDLKALDPTDPLLIIESTRNYLK